MALKRQADMEEAKLLLQFAELQKDGSGAYQKVASLCRKEGRDPDPACPYLKRMARPGFKRSDDLQTTYIKPALKKPTQKPPFSPIRNLSVQSALPLKVDLDSQLRKLRGMKDEEVALGYIDNLIKKYPKDIGLWLEKTKRLKALNRRQEALKSLGTLTGLGPDFKELHQAALEYQDLKDYPHALKIFRELVQKSPTARLLGDKGICEYLGGSKEQGIKDLARSLELDPKQLSAYLSLGAIYTERGHLARAKKLYDKGILLADREKQSGLYQKLKSARNSLPLKSAQ